MSLPSDDTFLISLDDSRAHTASKFTVYTVRWTILAIYSLATFINAALWITFASASTDISQYYGISDDNVELLSVTYLIFFLPGMFFSLLISKGYGVMRSFHFGVVCMALGAGLRFAAYLPSHVNGDSSTTLNPSFFYWMVLLGQILCAIAQPSLLTLSTQIPQTWFSADESLFAVFIAALFNPLGIAFGSCFTPMVISYIGNVGIAMEIVLGVQATICFICLITAILWFQEKPPTPPSLSEERRFKKIAAEQIEIENRRKTSSFMQFHLFILKPIYFELWSLLKNIHFIILSLAFSFGMAMVNIPLSLPLKMIPRSCTELVTIDIAYDMTPLIIISGLAASIIWSIILEITCAHKKMLKIGYVVAVCGYVSFLLILGSKISNIALIASFVLLGSSMIPVLPLTMENLLEMSYPHDPHLSSSLILAISQIPSIPGIIGAMALLQRDDYLSCKSPLTSLFGISSTGVGVFVLLLAFLYNGPNSRQIASTTHEPLLNRTSKNNVSINSD